jgi:hypothetical protein
LAQRHRLFRGGPRFWSNPALDYALLLGGSESKSEGGDSEGEGDKG